MRIPKFKKKQGQGREKCKLHISHHSFLKAHGLGSPPTQQKPVSKVREVSASQNACAKKRMPVWVCREWNLVEGDPHLGPGCDAGTTLLNEQANCSQICCRCLFCHVSWSCCFAGLLLCQDACRETFLSLWGRGRDYVIMWLCDYDHVIMWLCRYR